MHTNTFTKYTLHTAGQHLALSFGVGGSVTQFVPHSIKSPRSARAHTLSCTEILVGTHLWHKVVKISRFPDFVFVRT